MAQEQKLEGMTLHKAAAAGNVEACRQLLQDDPACVDDRDNFGRTALHVCMHLPTVAVLLAGGADTTISRQGTQLVTWHRSRGREALADLIDLPTATDRIAKLLAQDAVEDAVQVGEQAMRLTERWLGGTALTDTIRTIFQTSKSLQGSLAEARRLFREEEYKQAHDAYTHAAAFAPDSKKIAERLEQLEPLCRMQEKVRELEAKQLSTPQCVASAALTPPRGQKTLSRTHSGSQAINAAAVHRLLDSGAPLNDRDAQGRTVLIWAAENNLSDLVMLLLTRTEGARADPNITDNKGRSALHLAQTPAVASMLIRAGSDLQMRNAEGRMPEDQHRRHGRFEVAELIVEQGEILHLQGVAERCLMHGDANAASDAYHDALELCSNTAADANDTLSALRQSLLAGQRRASDIAEALASASTNADEVLKTTPPLVLPLPPDAVENESKIFRRMGALQAILNDRAPGRWTLTHCMGLGSSGMVVKATDTIRQEVAVKLVMPEQEGEQLDKADMRRLRREAQAMMRVQDPYVCVAYDSFFFPNKNYPLAFVLILEAVNGPTLAHHLSSVSQMAEVDVACVCTDILRALKAVHAAGLVHRDLKPDNICTTGVAEARRMHKLLDFGLARAVPVEQHRRSNHMTDTLLQHTQDGIRQVGTPHYMSPEQWSPEQWGQVSVRADLWAVGVLAYRMLTGRLPFGHGKTDVLSVWSAIVGDDSVSIKEHNPCISDGIESWVTKALQKKQGDRFCSAAEMEEELQRALVGDNLARYNIFISYRVKSEHELALAMFSTISAADAPRSESQTEERLAIFLDKVRLVDGQRWDEGFISALKSLDVFVPLVSVGALEPMTRLERQTAPDNVLLEWMLALWMYQNGHLKSILPLLVGKPTTSNTGKTSGDGYVQSLFEGLAQMERDGHMIPGVVHEPTRTKAVAALQQLGLDAGMTQDALEKSFDGMSVARTIEMIMCYQGCIMWDAKDQQSAVNNATDKIIKVARSFSVGGDAGLPQTNTAAPDAGGQSKLGSILSGSVMDVLQLRQQLAESQRHASAQARCISDLSVQVQKLTSQRHNSTTELTNVQYKHSRGSYVNELLSQLQADNDRLQRRVAKWKDLATVRQSELKALRDEHVALAHQATETRTLAYRICTGHGRLNSNSSARLQLDSSVNKQTSLRRPSFAGGSASAATSGHDLNAGLRAAVGQTPPSPRQSSKRISRLQVASKTKSTQQVQAQRKSTSKVKLSSMLAPGVSQTAGPQNSVRQLHTRQTAHAPIALPVVRQRS